MNWDAIGAGAEAVGAAAVVVSVAYLASQVMVSNRLARAEAWRVPNSDLNALNAAFGTDPVFRQVFSKVAVQELAREDLPEEEALVFDFYVISVLNIYEQIYREIAEGTLREDAIDEAGALSIIHVKYVRDNWWVYRPNLGKSFVAYFEDKFGLDGLGPERSPD